MSKKEETNRDLDNTEVEEETATEVGRPTAESTRIEEGSHHGDEDDISEIEERTGDAAPAESDIRRQIEAAKQEIHAAQVRADRNMDEARIFNMRAKQDEEAASASSAKASHRIDGKTAETSVWLRDLAEGGNISMADYSDAAKRAAAGEYAPADELERSMNLSSSLPQSDYQPDGGIKDVIMATAKVAGDAIEALKKKGVDVTQGNLRVYDNYLHKSVLEKVNKMIEKTKEDTETRLLQQAFGLVDNTKHALVPPPALGNVSADKKMRDAFLMSADPVNAKSGGIEFTRFLERAKDYLQNAKVSERSAYHLMSEGLKDHEALHLQLRVCERQSVPFHEAWISIQAADLSGQDALIARAELDDLLKNPPKDYGLVASKIEDLCCRAEANVRSKAARDRAVERRITDVVVNYVNKYNLALAGKIAERAKFLDIRQEKTMEECARRGVDYDAVTSKFDHPGWGLTYWLRTQKGWTGAHGRVGDPNELIRVAEVDCQPGQMAGNVRSTTKEETEALNNESETQLVISELRSLVKRELGESANQLRQFNEDRMRQIADKLSAVDKQVAGQGRPPNGGNTARRNWTGPPAHGGRSKGRFPGTWGDTNRRAATAGGNPGRGPRTMVKCYLCGEPGHIAPRCHIYPDEKVGFVTCHFCGNRHTSECKARGTVSTEGSGKNAKNGESAPYNDHGHQRVTNTQ